MKFCIAPKEYFNMFPMPLSVAVDYIKLCSEMQLKSLILSVSGCDNSEIASKLGTTENEIIDALNFWVQRDVLINDENAALIDNAETKPQSSDEKRGLMTKSKPKAHEAAVRCSEDERLKAMMTEAQRMLGRLVSPSEVSTMIWLHDNQGLDPAVILMAVQYAAAEGVKGFSYIENMCIGWARDGVQNVKDAEEQLKKLYLRKSAWGIVESAFGIPHRKPTKKEGEYADCWVNEWGMKKELLEAAYERCIDATGKLGFGYINKILDKWNKLGVENVSEIAEKEQESNSKSKSSSAKSSYNVDNLKSKFNQFD